jgi:hypothetical protein
LKRNFGKAVKKLKGEALKFFCLSFTGMPDRIVLMPGGRIWFVELKEHRQETNAPAGVCNWLASRRLGFDVRVIDTRGRVGRI